MPDTNPQIPGFIPPERRVFPGVRGKTKKKMTVDGELIPKGTEVIIQPLLDGKAAAVCPYKITTFKRDDTKSHLPESRRNIIPLKSYEVSVKNENDVFSFSEHYQATSIPLFAGKDSPNFDDIIQGGIPDCFLLAVLQSIINTPGGSDYIRNIMTQNADGTTSVRLFNPKTLTPEVIIVPNSVLVNEDGKALNHHKALWVHVMENAYVAMETKNLEIEKAGGVDASIGSVFSGGGYRETASRILLGVNSTRMSTSHRSAWKIPPNEFKQFGDLRIQISGPNNATNNANVEWRKFLDRIGDSLGYEGPDARADSEKIYAKYFEFYQENKAEFDEISADLDRSESDKIIDLIDIALRDNSGKYDDVTTFLKKQMNYEYVLTEHNTIRGEMGSFSGRYSEKQSAIYQQIQDELAKGNMITAGTNIVLAMKVAGIAGGHAYSVHQVIEKTVEVENPETGEKSSRLERYVQLRNPWGSYGRAYEQMEDSLKVIAKTSNEGMFEVELSDFCKYFDNFSITNDNEHRFEKEASRHHLQEQIAAEHAQIAPASYPSLQDLVEFKRDSRDHIFELEKLRLNVNNPEIKQHFKNEVLRKGEPHNDEIAAESLALAFKKGMQVPYNAAEDYIKNNVEGQQLLRLYKLDFLENIENKSAEDLAAIKVLKEDIIHHAIDASGQYQQGIQDARQGQAFYTQQIEEKLTAFDDLSAELDEVLNSDEPDEQLFKTYTALHATFIDMENMHQSLTALDPTFSNPSFDRAKESMNNSNEMVEKIEACKTLMQQHQDAVVTLLDETNKCAADGLINAKQQQDIEHMAHSRKVPFNDMHHLSTNKKLPVGLGSLLGALYRLKQMIVHRFSSIRNEIKHSRALSHDSHYTLESHDRFNRMTLSHDPQEENSAPKHETSYYKRIRQDTMREPIEQGQVNMDVQDLNLEEDNDKTEHHTPGLKN